MSRTRQYLFVAIVLIGALLCVALVTGCSGSDKSGNSAGSTSVSQNQEEKAISYNGQWHDDSFTADVTTDSIEIYLKMDDAKGLYWKGTWPYSGDAVVVSAADVDALDGSIVGSQDVNKTFRLDKDSIQFDFTAMGVTKVIKLER